MSTPSSTRRTSAPAIVGIDRASSFGYYAAKLRQEDAVAAGPLASTIVRATQFHEFAGQMIAQTKIGSVAAIPVMRSQPISARTLGGLLVDIAVAPPQEPMIEIASPQPEDVVSMARRLNGSRHRRIKVVPPLLTPPHRTSDGAYESVVSRLCNTP